MNKISMQQLISRLPATILSQMPHDFESRCACISKLAERDADGEVYKIVVESDGNVYLYIPAGSNIKHKTDFEQVQSFELVKGELAFNGKAMRTADFPAGEPHGTDPVKVDTIIRVANERIKQHFERKKRAHLDNRLWTPIQETQEHSK